MFSLEFCNSLKIGSEGGVAAVALANVELSRRILDRENRATAADIAGGIAHEINNALGPLLGQAQLPAPSFLDYFRSSILAVFWKLPPLSNPWAATR